MTTFDERIRALTWGRQLLEELAVDAAAPAHERDLSSMLLDGYPLTEALEARLDGLSGYALLLAVRRFERTSALLEQLLGGVAVPWADRAHRVARHYPECWELADAVRAIDPARVWAAMYLDRAPGRDGLLRCHRPAAEGSIHSAPKTRQRRHALRQLRPLLERLQRDPALPVLAVSETRQVMRALPPQGPTRSRMAAADLNTLNQNLVALQRACHILEAVVDGTFACSRRSRAWVQRVARRLPLGDWFAINGVSAEHRQEWLDALFRSRSATARVHRDRLLHEKGRFRHF